MANHATFDTQLEDVLVQSRVQMQESKHTSFTFVL